MPKLHSQQAHKPATTFFIKSRDHPIDGSVVVCLTTLGMLMTLVTFASVWKTLLSLFHCSSPVVDCHSGFKP
ncbi:MAG: hypothetical protein HZC38_09595 [Chloroflexi bacterium]|nr:hypothetical protein [Chloroflexota bacterium]